MKAPKFNFSIWMVVAITFFTLIVVTANSADASSIGRPYIGYTKIEFSDSFLDKLTEADVQFKRIKPGFLNLKRGTAIFPIVGGGVDFDNLIVELFHTGGLSLDSQDGMSVDLFNFVISNIIDFGFFPPSITGLTAIDGIIEARDVLFELAFTEENVKVKYNTLVISEVQITLNFFQAFNLNQLLGTNFEAGESVGTARVYARFHKEREHRYWKH